MAFSLFEATKFTDADLITSLVSSFYFLDYGFITDVNADKTVNVTHAVKAKTLGGESLPETKTTNIEVLTIAGAGFSLNFDVKKGDKVLLLGLKNYVKKAEDVKQAEEMKLPAHYSQETIKALPLCVFNSDAKVKIEIENGELALACSTFKVTDSNGIAALEVSP